MKKKQNSVSNNHPHNVALPEIPAVVNMDVLSYASDSEVETRLHSLNAERQRVYNMGYDAYAWEVELAYVQREINIREIRRAVHENYIMNNPDVIDGIFSSVDSEEYSVN